MKKDSGPVLKCLSLSTNTIKIRIDEMVEDVGKKQTLASEHRNWKFSVQLDESTFGCWNILIAYVRYFNQTPKQIIDEIFGWWRKMVPTIAPTTVYVPYISINPHTLLHTPPLSVDFISLWSLRIGPNILSTTSSYLPLTLYPFLQ